jgi:subtilisin family serine protease
MNVQVADRFIIGGGLGMFRRIKDGLALLSIAAAAAACGEAPSEPTTASDTAQVSAPLSAPIGSARRARTVGKTTGTVTLITGDRVTVTQQGTQLEPVVTPGPGRAKVGFLIRRNRDQITVTPGDMQPLVQAGRLDRELFDVTRLLGDGLADDQRDDLPLLITGQADVPALHNRMATTAGITVDHALPALHTLAVRQRKASPSAVLAALTSGHKIWLDRRLKAADDQSGPQIGAPTANARGFTGAGVTIAVVDTGIDANHPDFANKIIAAQDFVGDGNGTSDPFGHGTHVASIAAGTGAASNGQFRGIAFDAKLVNARVCDATGSCATSAILAGMEWAVTTEHAPIVNMSLGGTDTPEIDPLEDAVNTLSAQFGTLFVIAAGNDGIDNSIESPGSADAALTVGAVDSNNNLAVFSSRGPRVGDEAIKPDITAPGVAITAARAAGNNLGTPVNDFYQKLSGTSMATPHVAGSAALLLQQHPTWTGEQLKEELMNTAQPTAGLTVYEQGAGRVDDDRATRHAVSAAPGSESIGIIPSPHDQDPPSVNRVRYRNDGPAPVTLSLAASMATKVHGVPAAAGVVTVNPATITVPAGGTAEAELIFNTQIPTQGGLYGGTLVATGDDLRIITPIGIDIQGPMFNLTVNPLDVTGQAPADGVFVSIIGVGDFFTDPIRAVSADATAFGPITFQLPAGTYTVNAADITSAHPSFIIAPRVDLNTGDTTVTLDARLAKGLDLTLPAKNLQVLFDDVDFNDLENVLETGAGALSAIATAQVGPGPTPGHSHSSVAVTMVSPDTGASPATAPTDVWRLAHEEQDHMMTGWKATLRDRDFATVHARHAGRDDRDYVKDGGPVCDDACSTIIIGPVYAGPFENDNHYFGPGFSWIDELSEALPEGVFVSGTSTISENRRFTPGQRIDERWNQAAFGPVFAGPNKFGLHPDGSSAPTREDGFFLFEPSMFTDVSEPARESDEDVFNATLQLFENGTLIDEDDEDFFIPILGTEIDDDEADFQLVADYTRPSDTFDLSTHVTATWSFHSAPDPDGNEIRLALPMMRFMPPLDDHNRTAALVLPVPIKIDRPTGAPTPKLASATVDVSFDDGATWHKAPTALIGNEAIAVIIHPPGTSFVSLRGTATDVLGNRVDQTIIRAYGLTPR